MATVTRMREKRTWYCAFKTRPERSRKTKI